MKINEFDKTVDELYQLCRRVQKETGRTVAFHFANYKIGCSLHINIYKKESLREFDMYSIAEGGYQQEENVKKATDHLNKILMDNKCPYCEEDCDGEKNKMDFRAETVAEEYAELVGRLKAFKVYLDSSESVIIDKKICIAMLGLDSD